MATKKEKTTKTGVNVNFKITPKTDADLTTVMAKQQAKEGVKLKRHDFLPYVLNKGIEAIKKELSK